jgi:hypothetical protein
VVHAYNPSTQKVEVGGSRFKSTLGYTEGSYLKEKIVEYTLSILLLVILLKLSVDWLKIIIARLSFQV